MIGQLAGWFGAASLMAAYLLVSAGHVDGRSREFNGLNIAGGVLMVIGGWSVGAWPSVTLNLVWVVIGLRALRITREQER